MDPQNPQTDDNRKLTPEQLLTEARREVSQPDQSEKPVKAMTDADAQALLATRSLQPTQQPQQSKLPFGMIAAIVTLIVLAIIASFAAGSLKPPSTNKSSGSGASNSNSSTTDKTSNQINQYEQGCSDPATAISEC